MLCAANPKAGIGSFKPLMAGIVLGEADRALEVFFRESVEDGVLSDDEVDGCGMTSAGGSCE
jgi:hypothetical protein